MTGFIAGMLGAQIGAQHKATHSLAELAVPLGAVGFMIVVTGIGEVLARWAPRKALPGSH
jgi:hypothetical protein